MAERYDDIVKKVLVSEEEIAEITKRLGKTISTDYAGKELVLVGMLKGAMPFMMDLAVKLRDYALLEDIELNKDRMVDILWK